jgi:ribose transport system ATP-binding protein
VGLAVDGLTKAYAGVPAITDVSLEIADGEIHVLLGANGAGKSTVIKCVSGAVRPDAGSITIAETMYSQLTPREAMRAGVAVIYQELSGAPTLTVTDNIFLGDELRRGPFVRRQAQAMEAQKWLKRLGLQVRGGELLSNLDNAERQVVEIAKALRRRARVLVLDEPTAALTSEESRRLISHLKLLREHGLPVLYVTHRLTEVFEVGDRVTVLRGGEVALSIDVRDATERQLVEAIAGRSATRARERAPSRSDREPVATLQGVAAPGVGPIDLDVHAGEILGVFGLVGSGRTELLETLFGARRIERGTFALNGRVVRMRSPHDAITSGVALVPADRLRKSLFLTSPALDNLLLPKFTRLSRGLVRSRVKERDAFAGAVRRLTIRPPRKDLEARHFSGGNQQKLVLGRWLPGDGETCALLLLDEPTQGIDVGSRNELYSALRLLADDDRAIVVTSSEPEELIRLCERIVVLSRGRIIATVAARDADERVLLELAHKQAL